MSKGIMEQFKKQNLLVSSGIKELSVNVLTTGFWSVSLTFCMFVSFKSYAPVDAFWIVGRPSHSVILCNLPPEISACCEIFKEFYNNVSPVAKAPLPPYVDS